MEDSSPTLEVRCLASEVIKPSAPPPYPTSVIRSCKVDHVIANIYVRTLHFYCHQDRAFCTNDVLKRSLAQTLSVFYPLAGTLTPEYDILCNGDGALFVEAESDSNLSDLNDLIPHPRLLKLTPNIDLSIEVTMRPVLMVQVTRFKCGSVCLGVAMEHHVADGTSAVLFLREWSKAARGETISFEPSFDKAWLRPDSCPPMKPRFHHEEYLLLEELLPRKPPSKLETNGHTADVDEAKGELLPLKPLNNSEPNGHTVDVYEAKREELSPRKPSSKLETNRQTADVYAAEGEELEVKMFELSWNLLEKLKVEAGGKLTTYETLSAHVWKCCCEARELEDAVESVIMTVVDGRARLGGHHQNFIGNAIFNFIHKLRVSEIRRMGLAELGESLASALRSADGERCRSAIDFLAGCSDEQLRKFMKGPHAFRDRNLGIISWAKMPFVELDFGSGEAFSAIPAVMGWEGLAYLIPSAKLPSPTHTPDTKGKRRSLSLCITLRRRHMPTFASLVTRMAEEKAVYRS
ncbi:hypothetical protein KP509_25G051600 [Ceratopteris richardii]|uniref:Uncharacterized protein n=1 Tax=Ceratopteris richardii TaxID=49495 RepID=A0A8T2RT53_CERRI|nr:hypothetical protein KP509_25G051600 [Ceratopteris richardii]